MPKDYWAAARARDIAQKAIREGRAERRDNNNCRPKRRNRRKNKRKNAEVAARMVEAAKENICGDFCEHCENSSKFRLSVRRFKDGSQHVEMRCACCGAFIKWLSHKENNETVSVIVDLDQEFRDIVG